jgi:hypothetical protein
METAIMNLNKDSGDLNRTIQSVIKYISPMKKYQFVTFKTQLNNIPLCNYDSEQIEFCFDSIPSDLPDTSKLNRYPALPVTL